MTPRLRAAIDAGDYAESGRLALEIRMALRRAEADLAGVPDADAARARLAAAAHDAAGLLRAAPVLEDPDAGSVDAERAWQARRAAQFELTGPRTAMVRADWLYRAGRRRPDPARMAELLAAFRAAGALAISEEQLDHLAGAIELAPPSAATTLLAFELTPELLYATGLSARHGDDPIVTRVGHGLQILMRVGQAPVQDDVVTLLADQRAALVAAAERYTGLEAIAASADLIREMELHAETRNDVFLVQLSERSCRDLFGTGSWLSYLRAAAPDVSKQPLSAKIVQHADLVTHGEQVKFTIAVDWPLDLTGRARTTAADVEWHFIRLDGVAAGAVTPRTSRSIGDERGPMLPFELNPGEARGRWLVRATVRHERFLTAALQQELEVVRQGVRIRELEREAFSLGPVRAEPHDFRPTQTVIDWMTGTTALRAAVTGSASDSYHTGRKLTGTMQPGCYTDSLDELDRQIAQLDAAVDHLRASGEPLGSELEAARDRQIAMLKSVRSERAARLAAGARSFAIQGTYLSVGNALRSGPLHLTGTLAADPMIDGAVVVQIQDFSQRLAPEIYTFSGRGDFDEALQEAFWDLCKAYPGGRVSVLAERVDLRTGASTGATLGFELETGTATEDVRAVLFTPIVSRVVNLVGTAAMIFLPPPFNVIARGALAAYNSFPTVLELEDALAKGQLEPARIVLSLMDLGLNILPYADKLELIAGSRHGLTVLKGLDVGGGMLAIAGQLKLEVERLREGMLRDIATAVAELNQLQADNPSSPRITELQQQIQRQAHELRDATERVFADAAVDSLIQIGTDIGATRTMGAARTALDRDHAGGHAPVGGSNVDASAPRETRAGAAPAAVRTTAAGVAGSTFKGRAGRFDPDAVRAAASPAAIEGALQRFAGADGVRGAGRDGTLLVSFGAAPPITVRVDVGPLDGHVVSQTWHNPDKQVAHGDELSTGQYVIVLSDSMPPEHVERALAHEVAEIMAERALYATRTHAGADRLRAGAEPGDELSPHDRGRLAELEHLVATERGAGYEREMMALIEEMGLRDGTPGAEQRRRYIEDNASAEVGAELDRLRRRREHLTAAHAEVLDAVAVAAARDRAAGSLGRPSSEPVRATTDGKPVSRARLAELAADARAAKLARSRAVAAELRAAVAAVTDGYHVIDAPLIGGGAAINARTPGQLVIDAGERWHQDPIDTIAQTSQQLRELEQAGVGVPSELVSSPHDRVPVAALRYWQDTRAAEGPFIAGSAAFRLENGKLLLTITPTDEPPFTVQVRSGQTPVIASGFPPERAPGTYGHGPEVVRDQLMKGLDRITDASLAGSAIALKDHLRVLVAPTEGDVRAAIAAIDPRLRAALERDPATKIELDSVAAMESWHQMRNRDGDDGTQHVFTGDEANSPAILRTLDAVRRADRPTRVLIAGSGGTSVSAAENILSHDPLAIVVMVGAESPAGLMSNGQFRELQDRYGDRFRVEQHHLKGMRPTADGRYEMWSDETTRWDGDVAIGGLGRDNALPDMVRKLAQDAVARGGKVSTEPKFDASSRYTHYELTIDVDGQTITFDVTGSASRFMPTIVPDVDDVSDRDAIDERLRRAAELDAPPESGHFAGGYLGSANQAQRYRLEKVKRANHEHE